MGLQCDHCNPSAEDTDISLPQAGVYVLRLSASDGELSSSREVTVTRQADIGDLVYAINAGGGKVIASDGITYEADNYHTAGSSYSKSVDVSGTEDDELFYTERYAKAPASVDYAFPVIDGTYVVTLMWSENTGSGRIMDISAEGQIMIDNLNVISQAGGSKIAYEHTVTTTVSDGTLNLSIASDATATEKFPNIMAIRINSSGENSAPVKRVISITNVQEFIWTIDPEAASVDDDGSTTTFDGLDAEKDHKLTPAPSAGG